MAFEMYLNSIDNSGYRRERTLLYSTARDVGYNIIPGTIKEEVNKAGSFEFDVLYDLSGSNDKSYVPAESADYISVEDSNLSVSNPERFLFYGRVIGVSVDISGKAHVTCEGILANLLDFPMYMPTSSPTSGDDRTGIWIVTTKNTRYLFEYALTAYIEGTGHNDISIGIVDNENIVENDASDSNEWFTYEYPWNQSVGDFILSELVNNFGGILKVETLYSNTYGMRSIISWVADPISKPSAYSLSSQGIIYGDNILDVSADYSGTETVNGIFAVGSAEESNGKFYREQYDQSTGHYRPYILWGQTGYGDEHVKAIDFDGSTNQTVLDRIADRYVQVYCTGRYYTVNATVLDGYFLSQDTKRIKPLTKHHVNVPFVINPIDDILFCMSTEINIMNPASNKYTFSKYVPPDTLKAKFMTRG